MKEKIYIELTNTLKAVMFLNVESGTSPKINSWGAKIKTVLLLYLNSLEEGGDKKILLLFVLIFFDKLYCLTKF